MGEWHEIPELWKQGWTDRLVWMVTFALTVVADLTVAVEAGMILAALLFIRRVATTTTVSQVTKEYVDGSREHMLQDKDIPDYVAIFRIHGPFLFGATDKLATAVADAGELPPIVILRLRNMTAIDATGLRAIQDVADALRKSGRVLLLCGALPQPALFDGTGRVPPASSATRTSCRTWRRRSRARPRSSWLIGRAILRGA